MHRQEEITQEGSITTRRTMVATGGEHLNNTTLYNQYSHRTQPEDTKEAPEEEECHGVTTTPTEVRRIIIIGEIIEVTTTAEHKDVPSAEAARVTTRQENVGVTFGVISVTPKLTRLKHAGTSTGNFTVLPPTLQLVSP